MKPTAICFFLASILSIGNASAQGTPLAQKKGAFYFYWGYNRSFFSKTNLHFTGPNYDFTVYAIKGADKPSKFGWVYFNPGTFTVPQYVARLGYFITDHLAFSLGMDHMKYVVEPYQATKISGVITPKASPAYAGTYLNEPIQLKPELLVFEHTNGFNLVSLDFEYLLPLGRTRPGKFSVHWNTGLGGIWIVTKTDVRVLGDGLDNDFHVAGFTFVGKTGPRIEFKNRVFLTGELKGGYASLPSVLIKNAEPEIGDHNLSFLEWHISLGFNFGFRKKRN